MDHPEDIALLAEWLEGRSEAAFRTLAERYAPLVWGVALRKIADRSIAEEAVQQVFATLARKAAALVKQRRPLAAWLHQAAVYEAAEIQRRELRHRDRMKLYSVTGQDHRAPGADVWEEMAPHLDDAIGALGEADRRVLLLHWFERRTFAEVANQLGCTPAAAQRRGLRALDKLAAALKRRGAAVSATVLAGGLTSFLTPQVPAALTKAVCVSASAAASAAAAPGTAVFFQQCLHAMSSAKLTTAAVVLVSAALPVSVRLAASDLSGTKPSRAVAEAPSSAGGGPSSTGAASSAMQTAGALDLTLVKQALERYLANPGDEAQQLDLCRLMFSLKETELNGVLDLLKAVPAVKKHNLAEVSRALFARWAELDPLTAVETGRALRRSVFNSFPLQGAFITWAAADLDSAWAWLEKSPDRNELGGEALAAIIAIRGNGSGMMKRVNSVNDSTWQHSLRSAVLRAWALNGAPADIMDWAASLPDDGEKSEWTARAVKEIGAVLPDSGMSFLDRIENPVVRLETGHAILRPWVLSRGTDVSSIPADPIQEIWKYVKTWPPELYRDAGDGMARHDTREAMKTLRNLPESGAREEFVLGMLNGAGWSDASVMLPALEMVDEKKLMQHEGLGNFTKALVRQDPGAAAKWIASLPETSPLRAQADAQFQKKTGMSAAETLEGKSK